jgi:type IV secretory pathway TrbD component
MIVLVIMFISLAHTCNVWAVCVYVLEAAARTRARIRGVYFSLARLKKNYWADFNVI